MGDQSATRTRTNTMRANQLFAERDKAREQLATARAFLQEALNAMLQPNCEWRDIQLKKLPPKIRKFLMDNP